MKFGISLIMRGNAATPEAFVTIAERAEALELDSLWCTDHLIIPQRTVSRYPGRADGNFPDTWLERYWEPFTVLSFLAAHTSKIALGTSVLILPMRNPVEVAAQVAQLDQLCNGRFIFGVGAGWFQEEFDLLGWPFRERGARTNEGLALCKALWTQDNPSFQGRNYRCENANFAPKPARKPHPPIWIAGHSTAALRRVAKYGDGLHPFKPTVEVIHQGKAELQGLLAAEGRSLHEIEISLKGALVFQDAPPAAEPVSLEGWPLEGRPKEIIEALKRYEELGVGHFTFDIRPETLETALETMERFVQDVRPYL